MIVIVNVFILFILPNYSIMPHEHSLMAGKYNGLHDFMDGFQGRAQDLNQDL